MGASSATAGTGAEGTLAGEASLLAWLQHETPTRPNTQRPAQQSTKQGKQKGARPRPTEFGPNCTASGCHDDVQATPWVHAPVMIGSCSTCHTEVGKPEEHRFEPARPKETLCTYCHTPPTPEAHVHPAFTMSECTSCHHPHGGKSRAMLVSQDGNALCGQCHAPHVAPQPEGELIQRLRRQRADQQAGGSDEGGEGTAGGDGARDVDERGASDAPAALPHSDVQGTPGTKDYAFLHEPVAKGQCLDCHNAHQSQHEKLLAFPGRELCAQCHAEIFEAAAGAAHVHPPVEEDCRACHAGHGGVDERMLKAETRTLCLDCHSVVQLELSQSSHVHGALDGADSCLACHAGHHSESPALLNGTVGETCMRCHDEAIQRPEGPPIVGLGDQLAAAKFVHEPVAKGECTGCHAPHASSHGSLLAHDFPRGLYSAYTRDAYATCLECHDPAMLEEPLTKVTGFREGERNLHFVHVNQRKGRSCHMCHASHAADQPHLMRSEVPFGRWNMPIGYQATESGGSCGAACHKAQTYSRERPTPPPRKRDEKQDEKHDEKPVR